MLERRSQKLGRLPEVDQLLRRLEDYTVNNYKEQIEVAESEAAMLMLAVDRKEQGTSILEPVEVLLELTHHCTMGG